MEVQGHSIEEQWDLVEQFEGVVEYGLNQVIDSWLTGLGVGAALTAAGEEFTDGESSLDKLWQAQVDGVFTTYLHGTFDAAALAVAHDTLSQADLAAGLGVPGVPDTFTADFVRQIANKMVGVSDDLWTNISDEIAQGVAAGEDVDQLADRVRHAASVTMPRAQTVARTTLIQASNAGSFAQASLLAGEGGMRKTWVATEDMRTRPDHHNADGQTVQMTQTFTVGGWPLRYPGDPTAPAGEVINCRCTLTYSFDNVAAVCACTGLAPADAAEALAAAAPKLTAPMGSACVCPAVATLTPSGHVSKLTKAYDSAKKKVYADFQADGKITPAYGGAKIYARLQKVIAENPGLVSQADIEELLNVIDEQYALAGGKTSFKAKFEEWLQSAAGKKALPTVAPVTSAALTPAEIVDTLTYDASDLYHLLQTSQSSYGDLGQALAHIKTKFDGTYFTKAFDDLAKTLTDDQLLEVAKQYGVKYGKDTSWLGGAPTGGTVKTLSDVQDIAFDFGINPPELQEIFDYLEHSVQLKGGDLAQGLTDFKAKAGHLLSSGSSDAIIGMDEAKFLDLMKSYGDAEGLDTSWFYATGTTPAAPVAAAVNYDVMYAGLPSDTKLTLKYAWQQFKLEYNVSHDAQVAFDALKANFKAYPVTWSTSVTELSDADLVGLLKSAGFQQGDNTFMLDALGTTAPAAPVISPAAIVDKLSYHFNDFIQFVQAQLNAKGPAYVHDALAAAQAKAKAGIFLNSAETKLVGDLTEDQLVAVIKEYDASAGLNTEWLDEALAGVKPTTVTATPATGVVDLLDISSLTDAQVKTLLSAFKTVKPVTPKWKGAAIFKNLQLVKQGLPPEFAGLNDGQLLKALDKAIGAAPGADTSYYDAVIDWTKTPNGKKYLQDQGLLPPPEPGVTPATGPVTTPPAVPTPTPPPTPSAPPAPLKIQIVEIGESANPEVASTAEQLAYNKLTTKARQQLDLLWEQFKLALTQSDGDPVGAFAAVKYSLGSGTKWAAKLKNLDNDDELFALLRAAGTVAGDDIAPLTDAVKAAVNGVVSKPLGPVFKTYVADLGTVGDIDAIPLDVKQAVFNWVKGGPKALTSAATPEMFWSRLQELRETPEFAKLVKQTGPLSDLQLIRIIDEQTALSKGVANTGYYEKKLTAWITTPSAKQYVANFVPDAQKAAKAAADAAAKAAKATVTDVSGAGRVPYLGQNVGNGAGETFDIVDPATAKQYQSTLQPWTAAEKAALRRYTGSYYTEMNKYMREGAFAPQASVSAVRAAQNGMRVSTRPFLLHRGYGTGSAFGMKNATFSYMQSLVGKTIQDDGFISTSVGGRAAFSGQHIMAEIEAPTGTPMAYIQHISQHPSENEMLLAGRTKLKIISVTQDGHQIIVRLRVVP